MSNAPPPSPNHGTHLQAGGVSPLSLLTFFAAAKKVSAAPHRGNTNRPQRIQGKAKKKEKNQKRKNQSPPSNTRIQSRTSRHTTASTRLRPLRSRRRTRSSSHSLQRSSHLRR